MRFHLEINCGASVCQMEADRVPSDNENIRIDIEQFCLPLGKRKPVMWIVTEKMLRQTEQS